VWEFLASRYAPGAVAAARGADLAAFVDGTGVAFSGPFVLRAFNSASNTPLWSFPFEDRFNQSGALTHGVKVSRDGRVVACAVNAYDQGSGTNLGRLYVFDAAGNVTRTWDTTGFLGAVSLTDDGALAFVTDAATGRLIDLATGNELFSASASGQGGWFVVSGNGDTLVVGGFDLRVFRRSGGTYQNVINFSAPTSWFGWGLAVSRDGNTVGVMSHDYAANYLRTSTRIFDVPSATLLGHHDTVGTGSFQDSIAGAAMSDDGGVLAVSSWGTQDNAHPETMIFNRQVQLIGAIDSPGSPFGVDVSPDGRFVMVGAKAVHANTFGNGGHVFMFEVSGSCAVDITGDGQVNLQDFLAFLQLFASGDPRADFDGNTSVNIQDFLAFLQAFAAGC
jgi:hypothetical protein